jgi:hypothetical protein
MTNPYGVVLDDASLRWAAAESVPETVIAAICLLETRSVDEIVARLTPAELEQVIKIVGRCPRGYPPGAYDALKGHRPTPSPEPQPIERINPGPERLHRADERTSRSTEGTRRWTPPRRFAGFGAKVLQSATERAATNPYGITLSRVWTDWAAQHGVSETIAAALCLISRNRKVGEVVVKLTLGETERVIAFVQTWPDRFPRGALDPLNISRPTPPERSAACPPSTVGPTRSATLINPGIGQLRGTRGMPAQPRALQSATAPNVEKAGTPPGTRLGTRAETARRRLLVAEYMKAGLSVRTIAAGTGIPVGSVHRAMRAVARAQAKQEVAVLKIMDRLLNKGLQRKAKARI